MNAKFDPDSLSAYLDEELTAADRQVVQQHLADSPEDAALLRDFQMLGEWLRDLPRDAAPPALMERIRHQISADSQTTPQHPLTNTTGPAHAPTTQGSGEAASRQQLDHTDSIVAAKTLSTTTEVPPARTSVRLRWLRLKRGLSMAAVLLLGAIGLFVWQESALKDAGPPQEFSLRSAVPELSSDAALPAAQPFSARHAADMSEMAAATPGIPPVPRMESAADQRAIQNLIASPKWSGPVEPGELVHYISVTGDEVAVVELSVVDVTQSFGEIEVLLATNTISPAVPRQGGANSQTYSLSEDGSRSPTPQRRDSLSRQTEATQPAAPLADSVDSPADKGRSSAPGAPELYAFYVEATDTQVLQSLEQIESLEMIQQVRVGDSSRLGEFSYNVIPVQGASAGDEQEFGTPITSQKLSMLLTQAREGQRAFDGDITTSNQTPSRPSAGAAATADPAQAPTGLPAKSDAIPPDQQTSDAVAVVADEESFPFLLENTATESNRGRGQWRKRALSREERELLAESERIPEDSSRPAASRPNLATTPKESPEQAEESKPTPHAESLARRQESPQPARSDTEQAADDSQFAYQIPVRLIPFNEAEMRGRTLHSRFAESEKSPSPGLPTIRKATPGSPPPSPARVRVLLLLTPAPTGS